MKEADAVFLAVNWPRIDDVLNQAGDLSGKAIVTVCSRGDAGNTGLVVPHTCSGAEELAKKAKKAKVVSAFNTVPSEVLSGVFDARGEAKRPSLVYCGDDGNANRIAAEGRGSPTDTILIRNAVQQQETERHGAEMVEMFSSPRRQRKTRAAEAGMDRSRPLPTRDGPVSAHDHDSPLVFRTGQRGRRVGAGLRYAADRPRGSDQPARYGKPCG